MYVLQIQGIHHGLAQFVSEVDHVVGFFSLSSKARKQSLDLVNKIHINYP